jgi:peptidyl-dipeptidase Dcp
MEKSGALLTRVMMAFNGVTAANTDDALQKVQEDEAPKLAAHQDAITLNDKLFQRVQAVYDQRDSLKLDPESLRLIEVTYKNFVHGGAKLSDADKAKLKDSTRKSPRSARSSTTSCSPRPRTVRWWWTTRAKLAGLSDEDIAAAAAQAAKDRKLDGKWVLTLQNTTQQPAAAGSERSRHAPGLFEASWNRAEKGDANDTRDIIERSRRSAPSKPSCSASRTMPRGRWTTRWPRRRKCDELHGQAGTGCTARAKRRSRRHPGADRQGSGSAQAAHLQA